MSEILEKAHSYILDLFNEKLPEKFLFHDFNHTASVVDNIKEISANFPLEDNKTELLQLAGWFHDSGHVVDYHNHEKESVKIANEFLDSHNYDKDRKKEIERLILSTKKDYKPKDQLEEIIRDADILAVGKKNFFALGKALRSEWEQVCDQTFEDGEWEREQYKFLVDTVFYTEYAQKNYGKRRLKNIQKQEKMVQNGTEPKKTKLGRGIETMYRATYRNHINLSSIADNKANMMISINTIIMSLIITILGSGFTFTGVELFKHLRFTLPITFLLLACLISAIFSILSARPNVTSRKVDMEAIKNNKSSILFFGNFVTMKLQDFIAGMNDLKENEKFLYDNMSVDLYYLGIVLTRKYRLLRFSYNVFMVGVVLSVVAFLIMFFLSYEKL